MLGWLSGPLLGSQRRCHADALSLALRQCHRCVNRCLYFSELHACGSKFHNSIIFYFSLPKFEPSITFKVSSILNILRNSFLISWGLKKLNVMNETLPGWKPAGGREGVKTSGEAGGWRSAGFQGIFSALPLLTPSRPNAYSCIKILIFLYIPKGSCHLRFSGIRPLRGYPPPPPPS